MNDRTDSKKVLPPTSDLDIEAWMGLSETTEEEGLATGLHQNLRPSHFEEYTGQNSVKENLVISCRAAKKRGEAMDHVLIYGPPGLGKTTLARIIAAEIGVGFKSTSGPVIEKPGDLAAILTSLQPFDVLFIDEIHRLPRVTEEVLYPAMEDFAIDILIGQGPSARSVRIDLKPFTLVGATTRTGLLTSPLRDRFGMVERLSYYTEPELKRILLRSAGILGVELEDQAAGEIGRRSRGTPRIANKILRRVRDFAEERSDGRVTLEVARKALTLLDIDQTGLNKMDRLYLSTIVDKFNGGPVGIGTIAAALGEERDTIEDMCEPFLIREGLVNRTPRGREVTAEGFTRLGQEKRKGAQEPLRLL